MSDRDASSKAADLALALAKLCAERQRIYAERAQEFGYAKVSFERLSETLRPLPNDASLLPPLKSFETMLRSREGSLDRLMLDVSSASYATATANTSGATMFYLETAAKWPDQLHLPDPPSHWSKNPLAECAGRLEKLDPELGRLAKSVWQLFHGNSDGGPRAALAAMRQLYDHLFGVLAPDAEVRQSRFFAIKSGEKPNQVSRAERLQFAASKHVSDGALATLLVDNADQVIKTYNRLNMLHVRQELDALAVEQALTAMQAVIRQWVDAIANRRNRAKFERARPCLARRTFTRFKRQ